MEIPLSAHQIQEFATINARLGLSPEETTFSDDCLAKWNRPVILSSDLTESFFPPKMIAVNSISEMKELVGISDDNDDSHVEYPPPIFAQQLNLIQTAQSIDDLRQGLSEATLENTRKAVWAYLLGDSRKVADYKPLINTYLFPTWLAVFVATDITVTAKRPLIICPERAQTHNIRTITQAHNYRTITIKPGGYIVVQENAWITCQKFVRKDMNSYEDKVVRFTGAPYANPAKSGITGETGTPGPAGDMAVTIYNPGTCSDECSKQPTDGGPGGSGLPGKAGFPGADGLDGPISIFNAGELTENLTVYASGGDGQDGGEGGSGGAGGQGGSAGVNASPCTPAKNGPSGVGGPGGNGGNAGNGGTGAKVFIYCTYASGGITPIVAGGQAGHPGKGGTGGIGDGGTGSPGHNGDKGKVGSIPTIVCPALPV